MAGHRKSSSREEGMFGFREFCRSYRCFAWRSDPEKKRSPSNKRKSSETSKSFDEKYKTSNEDMTIPKDSNSVLRSQISQEVHHNREIPNSPPHNSKSSLSKTPSLLRTPTPTRSLTPQSAPLKRRGWSEKLETESRSEMMAHSGPLFTKRRGRSGLMAHSGPILRSMDRKASPNIMFSKSNGLVKLLEIEESLECSLEELCFGCVKKITVARAVIANSRQIVEEEETLSIKVKPGWTKGTEITFEGTKNEEKGTHSCDVIFVITEKKHELYGREGDDLELAIRVPLLQALTGCNLWIPLLDGDKINLTIDEIIVPGYEKIIEGQGMPKSREQGHRGNLKITFLVDFPKELTEKQRSDILAILKDSC